MNWDGEERRSYNLNLNSKFNDLELKLTQVGIKFDNSHNAFRAFEAEVKIRNTRLDETIYGNGHEGLTSKVNNLMQLKGEFKAHTAQDRWFQGMIFTGIIGILTKLIIFK